METLTCPNCFARNNLLKVIWNFPKYLFLSILGCLTVIQTLWLCFISSYKDEWAALIVLYLQLWIYISVFRSRTRIRPLTEDLYRISNMLHAYTIQKKKILKINIWVYCLFVTFVAVFFEMTLFNTGLIANKQQKLRNSELIPAHLKEHSLAILNCLSTFMSLVGNCFFATLLGYYCFVCCCMEQFLLHFKWKSKLLIGRQDYQRIFAIYREMNETMIMIDNFLNFPIFISVFNILASLFWYGYSFAFPPNADNVTNMCFSIGFVQYFILLLITLSPAAAANQAAATAREFVLSFPGWFPMRYSLINLHVRREFMHKTALTLWKIYRIDNSLTIRAIGSLISYGILVNTLGSVHNSNNQS
ncbi:uncharacterized protein CDAR_511451 [Caerostris darwini]|uniref:Odorant receptor n=1 Tax=Caerostris darwini TaxID=1538125 RepID=A0AAV4Q056_9ARAC|nr:uncharacterized protein CDAR_511451 [Caerostris darwini]